MIKVKPPYKPLVQMPYCCGCCAFLWILNRRGYWIDQEEIAWFCKLKILKRDAKIFSRKMGIVKSKKDAGTSPEKMNVYLNKMLKVKKIPLEVKKYFISQIENPKQLILENLKSGNDIMLDIACKPFRQYTFPGGHVCVVAEFNPAKEVLTLGDPGQRQPKFWKVSLKKIVKAMDKKYDGSERGFSIIKPK